MALWQRDGLTPPPAVLAAVNDYRTDEDTLADFIGACIQEEAGQCVPHGEVYRAYQQWATESGMRFPTTSKRLAKQLRERGWRDGFDSRKSKVWLGIQLSEAG
jgi:putative DNA primase/helicase